MGNSPRNVHRLAILTLAICAFGAADPARADVTPIKTPSGNIECSVGTGGEPGIQSDIRCVIFERSGPPAIPRPRDCAGPWGHDFSMRAKGRVHLECGGPGQRNTAPGVAIAPYGESGNFDGISCFSSRKGLRCHNSDGHGFFLSRRKQTVF